MTKKGGVLEALAAELETETAVSEISIPDETVSTSQCKSNNSTEERMKSKNINQADFNLMMNNEKNKYEQSDDIKDQLARNLLTTDGEDDTEITRDIQQNGDQLQVYQVTASTTVENLDNPEQATKYVKTSSVYMENNEDLPLANDPSNETSTDTISVNTNKIGNGQISNEDFQNDPKRSNEFAELTRENLEQHTRYLKKEKTNRTQLEDESMEKKTISGTDVTERHIRSIAHENDKPKKEANELNVNGNSPSAVSERLNDIDKNYSEKSESKLINGSITQLSVKDIGASSEIKDTFNVSKQNKSGDVKITSSDSHHRQSLTSVKKSPNSNVKFGVKKKEKICLDDVETLVSREKSSKSGKRKRRSNKRKETERRNRESIQDLKLTNEDSGIERDIDENGNFGENESNEDLPEQSGKQEDGQKEKETTYVQKRLLMRASHTRYQKRPVYDTTNTSTKMILLNNKYGKHSRLWTSQENQLERIKVIDPLRHLKEPSFYLSGNYHARCSTTNSQERPCFPSSNIKFDFSDRPHSEKIGDRLYGARVSVNRNRHRTCQCKLPAIHNPLDFSPPTNKERSNRYFFAWERLYAEPAQRPATSIRPLSTLSGKTIGASATSARPLSTLFGKSTMAPATSVRPLSTLSAKAKEAPVVKIPHAMTVQA